MCTKQNEAIQEYVKNTKQRGGARPNSGRPPKGDAKYQTIGFRADTMTRQILSKHDNVSMYIRNAIKFYDQYSGFRFFSEEQYKKIKTALLNYRDMLEKFENMQREGESSVPNINLFLP